MPRSPRSGSTWSREPGHASSWPLTHGRSPENKPGAQPAEWRMWLCSCRVRLDWLNSTATGLRHIGEVVTQQPPCLPPTIWSSCGFPVSCPGHGTVHSCFPCRAQALAPDFPASPCLVGSFVKFSSGCELPSRRGVRDTQPGHGCRVGF